MQPISTQRPGRLPGLVVDVDLADPVAPVPPVTADRRQIDQAWLLVRLFTEPVGMVSIDVPDAGLSARDVVGHIEAALGQPVRERLRQAGVELAGPLPVDGVSPTRPPPYLVRREEVLRDAPQITVVVCTRERPDPLRRCLDSLLAQQYPRMRILVVDNAPRSDRTAQVARAAAASGPVDYLVAPTPGLSHARNAAVRACPGQILAWIDDDEVADPYWLAEVARALADHPAADVVGGVIVPAELETDAQVWFEQFGGHSKGRGFTPAQFSPATAHLQSPLYPLPPFATGANMVFRPGVIEAIGGFDTALGAGTPAMGAEDTVAFTRVLLRGGTIVYQPSALVRHFHRRDYDGLYQQMRGYGTGLTAAYTALVLSNPRLLGPLLRLAPTALRDVRGGGDSLRVAGLKADFPAELLAANRRGMLQGPVAYLRGRWRSRAAT